MSADPSRYLYTGLAEDESQEVSVAEDAAFLDLITNSAPTDAEGWRAFEDAFPVDIETIKAIRDQMVMDPQELTGIQKEILTSLESVGDREEVGIDDKALELYRVYRKFLQRNTASEENLQSICVRLPLHCIKVALTLCLINREEKISLQTMKEAILVSEHSRETVEKVFGPNTPQSLEQRILDFVRQKGEITLTDLHKEFSPRNPPESFGAH